MEFSPKENTEESSNKGKENESSTTEQQQEETVKENGPIKENGVEKVRY